MPRRVGAYAKLLANYASDDAVIAAGEKAELLFVRGLAFCATSDSDGYITDGQLLRVVGTGMRDATSRAKTLVREGLWEAVDGGYVVRSWMKIHESAEEKGRARATDRERKRRQRDPDSEPPTGTLSVRSPSGQESESEPPSERNPNGVTADSLNCSVVTTAVPTTEQSRTEQSTESERPRTRTLAAALTSDSDPRFADFWSTYPRREAKAAALKALAKALASTPFDTILAAAQRYRDDPNRDPAFTAHAATWLNEGRWDDDPLPPRLRPIAGGAATDRPLDPATGRPRARTDF